MPKHKVGNALVAARSCTSSSCLRTGTQRLSISVDCPRRTFKQARADCSGQRHAGNGEAHYLCTPGVSTTMLERKQSFKTASCCYLAGRGDTVACKRPSSFPSIVGKLLRSVLRGLQSAHRSGSDQRHLLAIRTMALISAPDLKSLVSCDIELRHSETATKTRHVRRIDSHPETHLGLVDGAQL